MAVTAAPVLRGRNTGDPSGIVRLSWLPVPLAVTYVLFQSTTTGFTGTSEVMTLVVDATGGSFTITYSGQTTAAIPANSTAAVVQTALENLSNVVPGDVVVVRTGSVNAYTYTLTFGGLLSYANLTQITADATSLTGGASTATPATTTQGVVPVAVALDDTAGSFYFDTSPTVDTDYFYVLRTKNASGYSAPSNEVHLLAASGPRIAQAQRVRVVESVAVPTS